MSGLVVDLFSGMGGAARGYYLAGFQRFLGVELNPKNPLLSNGFKFIQNRNYSNIEHRLILDSVQEWVKKGCNGVNERPTLLHFSPVCSNYSQVNLGRSPDTELDLETARASCSAIVQLNPRWVVMENVPDYKSSEAFKEICTKLESLYYLNEGILDAQDFGVPQRRKRLFLIGTKHIAPRFPKPNLIRENWMGAIAGTKLTPTNLTGRQIQALNKYPKINQPLLIERVGAFKRDLLISDRSQPIWTLTKSIFHDGNFNPRRHTITYWDGSKAYSLGMRAIARLCGFDDDYWLPEDNPEIVGSGLGYCVCPPITEAIGRMILKG